MHRQSGMTRGERDRVVAERKSLDKYLYKNTGIGV